MIDRSSLNSMRQVKRLLVKLQVCVIEGWSVDEWF